MPFNVTVPLITKAKSLTVGCGETCFKYQTLFIGFAASETSNDRPVAHSLFGAGSYHLPVKSSCLIRQRQFNRFPIICLHFIYIPALNTASDRNMKAAATKIFGAICNVQKSHNSSTSH
jgi:hypothetical protein